MAAVVPKRAFTYARRRPEGTTLYRVVQENVETLFTAVDEGCERVAARVREEGAVPVPRVWPLVSRLREAALQCSLLSAPLRILTRTVHAFYK